MVKEGLNKRKGGREEREERMANLIILTEYLRNGREKDVCEWKGWETVNEEVKYLVLCNACEYAKSLSTIQHLVNECKCPMVLKYEGKHWYEYEESFDPIATSILHGKESFVEYFIVNFPDIVEMYNDQYDTIRMMKN
jgi:hypothetical protein